MQTFYACHGLFLEGHDFCDDIICNVTDCMTIYFCRETQPDASTAICSSKGLQKPYACCCHPPQTANRRINLKWGGAKGFNHRLIAGREKTLMANTIISVDRLFS